MGAGLLLIYAAGALVRAVPYPPARIAALVIAITPGDFATAMIERLGHGAIATLAVVTNLGTLAFGGYLGVLVAGAPTPNGRARRALAVGAALWLAAMGLAISAPEGFSTAALAVYPIAAYVCARILSTAPFSAALRPDLREGETPLDATRRSRRRFVIRLAAAAGGFVVGGATIWRLGRRGLPVDTEIVRADRTFKPPADDPSFPVVAGHSPEITANTDFYTVDINIVKPMVDHEDWTLRIHGLVDAPYNLDYRTLQADFEVVEMAHTLTCISNEVGGDLVSTTVWRGVRLRDVLERAGIAEGVVDVVFRAVDGYSDSIPLAKAVEDTTLVAFGMNGDPLPREHGFPARIIVPGIYGMKNVKWITEISTVDRDYRGYWMVRGWSDVARVKTQSRIDAPAQSQRVEIPAQVAGVAWAGDRRISAVEVSFDDGASWHRAQLMRELSPVAWRLWVADVEPGSGSRRVIVRATDGAGEVQASRRTRPHPDGASGRHETAFTVS